MLAASSVAKANLGSGIGQNKGVDVQRLRQLVVVGNDKPQRTTEDPPFSKMAQFVVHDLRHHLCAIYANAEFMCSRSENPSDREELFDEIRSAIVCMTDQLDALLLLSKTGSAFHLRRQSLKSIVELATQMVRSHPVAELVNLTSKDMPFIEGHVDGKWLCSAIFNLLLNACQAVRLAPKPWEVVIALQQDLSHVAIRVTDSGPGVPRSIQKSFFQPFVGADHRDGMGLGLPIAECVAREHGGEVCLEESRPGRTSFVLRLPNTR
ncbi:K+-sensing histidine kinase KdpD [Silvibacterium bohemicum]|uniref:histidine kinase n=1 Tax=Silvibacterium bohemicum TaxID=1577686 RepID=A0A841K2K1_9BACT|nr:HAMP domain-containing sensor histidine kinase [Silvibacterium bohemicum]MBB6146817.1 K+-sensing histidine kinase KdpD [Silvibacterium bohemicum]